MKRENTLLLAGALVTGATLSAGHWFPWWSRLNRLQAYAYGTMMIALGQGVAVRFDRRWRRSLIIPAVGGLVTLCAYLYDRLANHRVRAAIRGKDEQVPIS